VGFNRIRSNEQRTEKSLPSEDEQDEARRDQSRPREGIHSQHQSSASLLIDEAKTVAEDVLDKFRVAPPTSACSCPPLARPQAFLPDHDGQEPFVENLLGKIRHVPARGPCADCSRPREPQGFRVERVILGRSAEILTTRVRVIRRCRLYNKRSGGIPSSLRAVNQSDDASPKWLPSPPWTRPSQIANARFRTSLRSSCSFDSATTDFNSSRAV
jgi:hypothetical protein